MLDWPSRDKNHGLYGHNLELASALSPPSGSWWGAFGELVGGWSIDNTPFLALKRSVFMPETKFIHHVLGFESETKRQEEGLRCLLTRLLAAYSDRLRSLPSW